MNRMDATPETPFPASEYRGGVELPLPEMDTDTPMAVQIIDAALAEMSGTGRSTVSIEWFHNVLLDLRSAVTNSVSA